MSARPVALAAASFGSLGACLTLAGTLLPVLVTDFRISLVEAGSMLAFQPAGYLVAVLVSHRLIARFGVGAVTSAGLAVFGLGIAGFGLARGWPDAGAMMLVSGLGFGLLEVAGNALVVIIAGARRMNVLNFVHLFFGVGSFVAPAATAWAVTAGASWRHLFVAAGAVTAGVGLLWRLVTVAPPAGDGAVATASDAAERGPFPLRWLIVSIGLYVGVETGLGAWITNYTVSVRGSSLAVAGTVLSGYWLGLAAGRLALSVVAHRVEEAVLLRGLAAAAAVSLAAALVVPGVVAAGVCFAAVGAAFSGIFPALIALGGRARGADPAAVTQRLIIGAGVGTIVIPWMMSGLAEACGLVAGMAFYAVLTVAMVASTIAVQRTAAGALVALTGAR